MKVKDRVIYKGPPREYGTVTSANERYVFVLFDGDQHSKACSRETLEYEHPIEPPEQHKKA